ncbi:MAG: single-stranded DNA-binding protein [Pseudomonadota bacterium]
MNFVHLVGRLGADPDIQPYSDENQPSDPGIPRKNVVRFDIAVEQPFRPNAKKDRPVDWIPIVIFDGPSARYAAKAIHKGDLISLSGRIDTRRWTDDKNRKRKDMRVIVLDIEKLGNGRSTDPTETGGGGEPVAAAIAGSAGAHLSVVSETGAMQ